MTSANTPNTNTSNANTSNDASTGELVSRLSTQLTTLVRDEMRLAQAEVKEKAKKTGIGIGLFGGAGIVALYGLGALVACAIIGLATAVDAWLAALIVGIALLAIAGVLALVGKKEVTAPLPTEAVAGVKTDVSTLKESAHR